MKSLLLISVSALAFASLSAADKPQLDEDAWPVVTPEFYDAASDRACQIQGAYFKGQFISAPLDKGARGPSLNHRLRRSFTVKEAPVHAWLQGLADQVAIFRVNGQEAFRARYNHNQMIEQARVRDVAGMIKVGENQLSIEYQVNEYFEYYRKRNYPGGIVCELLLVYADGHTERIDSDSSFEGSDDGKTWAPAVSEFPLPPAPPHGTRFHYVDFAHPQALVSGGPAKANLQAGEETSLSYVFKGPAPEGDFTVRLALKKGGSVYWNEEIYLNKSNVIPAADGTWKLEIPFETPLYISGGSYEISIDSNSIYCPKGPFGGSLAIAAAMSLPGAEKAPVVEVKPVKGVPQILMNGKPYPVLWGGVQQDRRPDGVPRHGPMPLTLVTVYNNYWTWHPKLGVYDFSFFDNQAEQYRRQNPDAYFVWDLSVYPPPDFAQKYPGEMECDETGDATPIGRFSWSWASKPGLAEIQEMITKAIQYLEASPYANRIVGYRVNSGVTLEWLGWDAKDGQTKGFSAPTQKAYAEFAARHYPELKDPHVPGFAELHELDGADDVLWDRSRHLNAIAFMDYNSHAISADLLSACGTAKDTLKALGRTKMVGTYFGYTFYLNNNGRSKYRGHYALEYLLEHNNGRVDFFLSPNSYDLRRLGEIVDDMKPYATLQKAGIMTVREDDSRTHNRQWPRVYHFNPGLTGKMTREILERNAAFALCQGSVPYFYALDSGLDQDSPECGLVGEEVLSAVKEEIAAGGAGRSAEVALVASEKAILASPDLGKHPSAWTGRWYQDYNPDGTVGVGQKWDAFYNGEIFGQAHALFARTGAPVDYLLAEDLKNRPGDYKVYVFLNQTTFDDAFLAAVEKLRARGATLLWLYAPGWSNANSLADMERLTGLPFEHLTGTFSPAMTMKGDGRRMGYPEAKEAHVSQLFSPTRYDELLGTYDNGKPGLVLAKVGASTTYFSGTWLLDLKFIRAVEEGAGVHFFSDTKDPIEANDALVTLHARTAGLKTLHLPRKVEQVIDLFTGDLVAENTDTISFEAPLHSTRLFYYGKARRRVMKPDVFIGTQGLGHVTPAATSPFGLVQVGPDTSEKPDRFMPNWAHTCGYQHSDTWLWRISQTHLSGTGCSSFGDFGVLPLVKGFDGSAPAKMLKETESAQPGRYGVTIDEKGSKIACELVALPRSSVMRFTFDRPQPVKLLLDLNWGIGWPGKGMDDCWGKYILASDATFQSPTVVQGFHKANIWNAYQFFFNAQFSAPIVSHKLVQEGDGVHGRIFELDFGTLPSGVLEIRMGLSSTSSEAAARNLFADVGALPFDAASTKATQLWRDLLARMEVGPGADPVVQASFESALYRLFLQPNNLGNVQEPDAYSTLSLWDTYRAAHPLYTILTPERVGGFINSMLDQCDRQGFLPLWALGGNENYCMIGHHSVPVIVDAFLKERDLGLNFGVDWERAYRAVKQSITVNHHPTSDACWGLMKEDWDLLDKYGYYPYDLLAGWYKGDKVKGESVSRLLECAYDDACAGRMARALGKDVDAAFFEKRASNWKNVFDPSTGFMRGRDSTGKWREPFDPFELGGGPWGNNDYCEGNAWQYTWHVMQDPQGLIAAYGGREPFLKKLVELFEMPPYEYKNRPTGDVSGLIGQYAHGNEPSHHVIYFFTLAGRPDLAAKYVRKVFDTQYSTAVDGLCGNDDCGQMAAWCLFSAMGFYPFDPCGGEYVLGAPQLPEVTLHLPQGRTFRVVAKGLSKENLYVKSVTLNGRPITDGILHHKDLMAGGTLVFEMSPQH